MWFLLLKQNYRLDIQGTGMSPTYLVNDGKRILILPLHRRKQVRCLLKRKLWKFSVDINMDLFLLDFLSLNLSVTWDVFWDLSHPQPFTFDDLMISWFSNQLILKEYMNPLKERIHSLIFHSPLVFLDLFILLWLLSFDCPTTSHW